MKAEAKEIEEEVIKDEIVEPDGDGDLTTEEPELEEDGNAIEEDRPAFLDEVDDTVEPKEPETVPLSTYLKLKGKNKEQRTDQDAENERLRVENERLKSSAPSNAPALKLPNENDFDSDEDYNVARNEYEVQNRQLIIDTIRQDNTQNQQQNRLREAQEISVNDHNLRAEAFVKQQKIKPEVYINADSKIRQAIETVMPNESGHVFNTLIHRMGSDSEKVILYLGNNKERLDKFTASLRNDTSGIEAGILVGGMKEKVKKTTKRTSNAPAPADSISGGDSTSASSNALKRAYDKAKGQEAFTIKQKARQAGTNTEEW